MEIKIYQINRDRDKNFVKFLHYKHLDNFQETKDINASIYDEVFRGDADCEEFVPEWAKENTQKYLEADDLADEPDEDGGMTLGGM